MSVTSRPPRPGERDGRDYRFVSPQEFDRAIRRGEFLEWAEVFGHRYGTLGAAVTEQLERGRDVILEIDVQGATKVKDQGLEATFIFVAPPEERDLAERLRQRDTESQEEMARRLAAAGEEMRAARWFDHVVINDDVERAAAEVAGIIADRTA